MNLLTLTTALVIAATSASAQHKFTTGGSQSSTPTTGDVNASTYGSGTSTDGVGVSGGGNATTANGGTANTASTARFNENTARQRSVATARDDDERARSRTSTRVQRDGDVRSKSMSIYKQRGEKAVIERQSTTSPN